MISVELAKLEKCTKSTIWNSSEERIYSSGFCTIDCLFFFIELYTYVLAFACVSSGKLPNHKYSKLKNCSVLNALDKNRPVSNPKRHDEESGNLK